MARDLHIYTNGVDPFTFKVRNVVVHVHAGAQPGGGGQQPIPDPATYTDLPPVLGVRVLSPRDRAVLEQIDGSWGDEQDDKVIARTRSYDAPSMSQLETVLDGVSAADNDDITVLVFQLDDRG